MKDQNQTPLFDAIQEYNRRKPAYFRIPGHRYERGINTKWREVVGDAIFGFDLTETPLTDDLHHAGGPIKEAELLASDLWGSDYTHFLVNGTTCANEAMVITTAHEGETICIPRNAHKSVLYGLTLSGAKPIYLMPQIEDEWVLHGGISPEQAEQMFNEHPECKGLLVVSPTYYGLASDVEGLAEVCHRHNAVLMVDEAHGAHCYFSDKLPKGGIQAGADMCAQSIHKVSGSFTQSSMIHVKSKLVNRNLLDSNLMMLQSTSPSYVLMTSLDMARHEMAMHGSDMIDRAVELAKAAREALNLIPGVACAGHELIGRAGIAAIDETRMIISAAKIGITGFALKKMLFDEYDIDVELADYRNVVAIVTYANEKEDLDSLVSAMADIAKRFADGTPLEQSRPLPTQPEYVCSPRQAYFAEKEACPWEKCIGRVAAEMIAPYPPGIPVIYQGERMSKEVWDYIEYFRQNKGHLHGPADPDLDTFRVLKEE